jgi:hypothetical protein
MQLTQSFQRFIKYFLLYGDPIQRFKSRRDIWNKI